VAVKAVEEATTKSSNTLAYTAIWILDLTEGINWNRHLSGLSKSKLMFLEVGAKIC